MILNDVIEICKLRLKNIAKSRDDEWVSRIIHLGVVDLYNRFNLRVSSEVIETSAGLPMYEVRDPSCEMIISLYDTNGNELMQSDVLGSILWQWKQINFRSFLLNKPKDGQIICAFKASPRIVRDVEAHLDLPEVFIEALIMYVIYMTSSTVQSQASTTGHRQGNEAQTYRQMYEDECNRLIMMGYKINLNTERLPIQVKGFV